MYTLVVRRIRHLELLADSHYLLSTEQNCDLAQARAKVLTAHGWTSRIDSTGIE